jgi:anti-sigma factor RsiW
VLLAAAVSRWLACWRCRWLALSLGVVKKTKLENFAFTLQLKQTQNRVKLVQLLSIRRHRRIRRLLRRSDLGAACGAFGSTRGSKPVFLRWA